MGQAKTTQQLAKLLAYVLGRRPDEFGLVPDSDGWVSIKELLQALAEENGWRHVRSSLLSEIRATQPAPVIELSENRVRAEDRTHLSARLYCADPPKLLFTGVTRKSYAVVREKGVFPTRHPEITLAATRDIALRIASRRDRGAVILTVNTQQAMDGGVVFHQYGESLFLADFLPTGCFTGPPLPKPKPETGKKDPAPKPERDRLPGSFILNLDKEKPKEDGGSWKRDKKRIRREKQKKWYI